MNIGILGTADIAFRRFLPALQKCSGMEYAGVASRIPSKGLRFQETFGGEVYPSYDELLEDSSIDAVYVPLPPALHYEWGRKVLESGKHLFMEKPFTICPEYTQKLLALAEEKNLAVHENYMFLYHCQLSEIKKRMEGDALGEIRLFRISFGFPKRSNDDFRYNRALGGGALLDCGGYPVRMALELLGETAKVKQASLIQPESYEVDLFGNAVLQNQKGWCAQISFGMDNAYQCQLEIWGSKATLIAPRVFTAGVDVEPSLIIRDAAGEKNEILLSDDQFLHSIEYFLNVCKSSNRAQSNLKIYRQSVAVDVIRKIGGMGNGSY